MQLADKANQYIDFHKPWELNKNKDNLEDVKKLLPLPLIFLEF